MSTAMISTVRWHPVSLLTQPGSCFRISKGCFAGHKSRICKHPCCAQLRYHTQHILCEFFTPDPFHCGRSSWLQNSSMPSGSCSTSHKLTLDAKVDSAKKEVIIYAIKTQQSLIVFCICWHSIIDSRLLRTGTIHWLVLYNSTATAWHPPDCRHILWNNPVVSSKLVLVWQTWLKVLQQASLISHEAYWAIIYCTLETDWSVMNCANSLTLLAGSSFVMWQWLFLASLVLFCQANSSGGRVFSKRGFAHFMLACLLASLPIFGSQCLRSNCC